MTRANFTNPTMRAAYKRSNGTCECHLIPHVFEEFCGLPLGDGNTFYEHIDCDAISRDNRLENCAVLTLACWRYKTDFYDKPMVAKSNRVQDRARGIGRTPRSRSFPTNKSGPMKKTFYNGTVRR